MNIETAGSRLKKIRQERGLSLEDVQKKTTQDRLWSLGEALLPEKEPWLVVEGLIELGALVCKKEPLCFSCPLKATCKAYRLDLQKQLPRKEKKKRRQNTQRGHF